jgi:hypothetical protein
MHASWRSATSSMTHRATIAGCTTSVVHRALACFAMPNICSGRTACIEHQRPVKVNSRAGTVNELQVVEEQSYIVHNTAKSAENSEKSANCCTVLRQRNSGLLIQHLRFSDMHGRHACAGELPRVLGHAHNWRAAARSTAVISTRSPVPEWFPVATFLTVASQAGGYRDTHLTAMKHRRHSSRRASAAHLYGRRPWCRERHCADLV